MCRRDRAGFAYIEVTAVTPTWPDARPTYADELATDGRQSQRE
jgi:hypothetical protein